MTTPYTGSSIIDYLSSTGADSSFSNRAKLAASNGISGYQGTADQNTQLLGILNKPAANTSSITSDSLTPDNPLVLPDTSHPNTGNIPIPTPTFSSLDPNSKTYKQDSSAVFSDLVKKISGESSAQSEANIEAGVQKKKDTYNALDIQQSKLDQDYLNEQKRLKENNPGGTFGGALSSSLNDLIWKYQSQRAEIGINKALAMNDYNSAVDMANEKVKAQFQPIKDQLDALKQFQEFNKENTSMTDSEKMLLQQKITQENAKYSSDLELAQYKEKKRIDDKMTSDSLNNLFKSDGTLNLPTSPITYTSKSGDKPNDIASKAGISIADLQTENPGIKDWSNIPSGTVLKLPQSRDVSTALVNSDGTYNKTVQDNLLSRLPPERASLIRSVGEYRYAINKITSLTGGAREKLATEVSMIYPNFSMANYEANQKYVKDLASVSLTSSGGIINSANKMINHLTAFADFTTELQNGGISSALNAFRNNTASPFSPTLQRIMASAQTSALGVKEEMAKFFKGTGVADVKTLEEWGKRIDPNSTPASLKGNVQAALDLLQGQLSPMMDQYKSVIGKEPDAGVFLKPDTIKNLTRLKNEGYTIDIPGVYYTDKASWKKYGLGDQEQWNSAINKLNLVGIPLTDENILQASQLDI